MDETEQLRAATGDAAGDARRRVRRPGHRRPRPGRGRVPGLPHVDGVGRLDARRRAQHARPQPAGDGDDRRARPDGGVPPPRRAAPRRRASPTTRSTSSCSRSPRTAGRLPGVSARREIQAIRADARRRLTWRRSASSGWATWGASSPRTSCRPGHAVVAHDALGPERVPEGAYPRGVRRRRRARAPTSSCSASPTVRRPSRWPASSLAAADRRITHVVDTSTIGVRPRAALDRLLADGGIAYVDAPVSGGVAGARARTLAVMYAGTDDACAAGRAGARRPERPPPPGRRPARSGARR